MKKNRLPDSVDVPHQNSRWVNVCCSAGIFANVYNADTIYANNYVPHCHKLPDNYYSVVSPSFGESAMQFVAFYRFHICLGQPI